jgi:serine O-acetyltransferase
VDGDSELEPGWLQHAVEQLDSQPSLAALSGRIHEKFLGASIYNQLADREWDVATGQTESCAGICAIRVEAFEKTGGFDAGVAAGEEPELCQRIRQAGYIVMRIAFPMAIHDIALLSFGQWWRRQVRSGFRGTDVARRFGHPSFEKQIRSARRWGLALPAAIIVLGALAFVRPSPLTLALLAAFIMAAPAQALRLGLRARRRGLGMRHAMAYGLLTMIAKWAHLVGQYRWFRNHRAASRAGSVEKVPAAGPMPRASLGRGGNMADSSDWKADLRRYPPRPFLREQSVWAIALYRFGRRNDRRRRGPVRWIAGRFYWLAFRVVETLTGVSIPKAVEIGPGLRIHHFGNIEFGAYAQVLGGIRVGTGAKIGAMSVVLCDVPPGATAVGIPARIIMRQAGAEPDQSARLAAVEVSCGAGGGG